MVARLLPPPVLAVTLASYRVKGERERNDSTAEVAVGDTISDCTSLVAPA